MRRRSEKKEEPGVRLHAEQKGDLLVLSLLGRLDATTIGNVWQDAVEKVDTARTPRLILQAEGVEYCDGAGIGLLVELCCRQHRRGGDYELQGLRPEFRQLFELFNPAALPESSRSAQKPVNLPEEVGRATFRVWEWIRELISFTGELTVSLLDTARRPRRMRWGEIMIISEKSGVNALPVVLLVSFLVGLIMAFQAAIPLRQFGAEIFVANLIGLSMLRELAPLMTAMVLAGRSGSAFAAELGTMKVNEEIDALKTMGLDPVRFLVVNRVIAVMLIIPLLTIFAGLVGVMGGSVVLLSLGYPLTAYINQLLSAVTWVDVAGGLFKSVFFGLIVAGIGCLHGLQTKVGASAVGDSATRAVVSGNVLIIIADGIFAVLFFVLGI